MGSSIQIEEQAAAWLVRRDGAGWTSADEADLSRWLSSTAHRVAFIRLQGAWQRAHRMKVLGAGVRSGEMPEPGEWKLSPFVSSRQPMPAHARWKTALAAGLAAVLIGAGWYLWPVGTSYSTPVGGLSVVPMGDGSKITLNTASELRVKVSEHERFVTLEQGEAYFEVAKDARRPFVVEAGGRRVVVVGTRFSARRQGRDLQVIVTEGAVRVEGGAPIQLSAGAVAHMGDIGTRVEEKSPAQLEDLLSWRGGYVVFKEVPLGEAAAEFNRYNEHQILIRDPRVAMIRVSGNFRSTNVEAFIRLVEEGFAVRSRRTRDGFVLTKQGGI